MIKSLRAKDNLDNRLIKGNIYPLSPDRVVTCENGELLRITNQKLRCIKENNHMSFEIAEASDRPYIMAKSDNNITNLSPNVEYEIIAQQNGIVTVYDDKNNKIRVALKDVTFIDPRSTPYATHLKCTESSGGFTGGATYKIIKTTEGYHHIQDDNGTTCCINAVTIPSGWEVCGAPTIKCAPAPWEEDSFATEHKTPAYGFLLRKRKAAVFTKDKLYPIIDIVPDSYIIKNDKDKAQTAPYGLLNNLWEFVPPTEIKSTLPPLPQEEKDTPMEIKVDITVSGTNILALSKNQLLNMVRAEEHALEDLKKIKAESSEVKARIEQHEESVKVLVTALDNHEQLTKSLEPDPTKLLTFLLEQSKNG